MRLRSAGIALAATTALIITACTGPAASPSRAPAGSPGATSGATSAATSAATTAATRAPGSPDTSAPTTGATPEPTSEATKGASPPPLADRRPSGTGFKIGAVTDVGQLEDKSFNEYAFAGVIDAATRLGGTCDVIVSEEIADYASNMQTLVDEGYDAIVTIGFLLGSDTLTATKANPDVFFVGIDQSICLDEEGNNDTTFTCAGDPATLVPNYQAPAFAEGEPGYLAGIIAASISESGVVGAVGGTNVPAVVRYRDGYTNGAKSVNPDVEVLYVESNADPVIGFNDPERGAEIANQMIGQEADVLFQIAGGTGVGVLEAACGA